MRKLTVWSPEMTATQILMEQEQDCFIRDIKALHVAASEFLAAVDRGLVHYTVRDKLVAALHIFDLIWGEQNEH